MVSISQVSRVDGAGPVPSRAGVVCVAEMVLGGVRASPSTLVGGGRALMRGELGCGFGWLVETSARPSVVALPLRGPTRRQRHCGRSITRRRVRGQPFPGPRRTIKSPKLACTKHSTSYHV